MNNFDLMERNELSKNSKGGTELLQERLYDGSIPRELLENVQIIFSRTRELQPNKKHILYLHDLPEDPESQKLLDPEFRNQFDLFVFVSNWQLQEYNTKLGIPYSKSVVINNSILPIDTSKKPPIELDPATGNPKIRLIYHSTPHRGLELLLPTFIELQKEFPELYLDVFSSFKLYGWEERDEHYKQLFDICDKHPNITNHGSVSNEELRTALLNADIFPYPCIWKETSCLCLIEAMSSGLFCIHPNLAALPETSKGVNIMYQWTENPNEHLYNFYHIMRGFLIEYKQTRTYESTLNRLFATKLITDLQHDWNNIKYNWINILQRMQQDGNTVQ